jgi:hypothetical protein
MANTEQALNKAIEALTEAANVIEKLKPAANGNGTIVRARDAIAALTAASAEAAMPVDFSKPLETIKGEPVTYVCSDVIEYKSARVCVDQTTGVVYSSPYIGLRIRNAAPQASQPIGQPVSGAELTDEHYTGGRFIRYIEAPRDMQISYKDDRAVLSASGQASQSEKARATAQSSQIVARMPDGSTAANVYEAFERGRQSAVRDAEKVCDKYKRGVMDLVNVRELQRAIRALLSTPAQQTDAPVNVPELNVVREAMMAAYFGTGDWSKKLNAAISLVDVMLTVAAPAPVDQTEAQQSADKWKQMAEYQYAIRQYPNELELGQGALDDYFKTWTWDAAIAKEQDK